MNLPNKPKVLAATYNPISDTEMFTVMVDIPYMLLPELLQFKELTITYKKIENIELQNVLDNPFIPNRLIIDKHDATEHLFNKNWLKFLNGDTFEKGIKQMYHWLLDNDSAYNRSKNYLLAPFAYTTCIISGTEWDNFFEWNCPKYYDARTKITFDSKKEYLEYSNSNTGFKPNHSEDFWQSINKSIAQPEIQVISELIYDLYQEADWKESKYHIPFYDDICNSYYGIFDDMDDVISVSAFMCSTLSYNTENIPETLEECLEKASVLNQDAFNHQAIVMDKVDYDYFQYRLVFKIINTESGKKRIIDKQKGWYNNLKGFVLYNSEIK